MVRLFVAGSANIDLTFRMDEPPRPGVTSICPYSQGFGGKGANQAVQAARLGAAVTFLGKVGDDAFGPALVQHLAHEGIKIDHLATVPGCLTGTAVILIDRDGQNSIISHAGPNVYVSKDDIENATDEIIHAHMVLATLETPAEALQRLFEIARNAHVLTLLNPAPPVTFPLHILRNVDICIPNESELEALTGRSINTVEGLENAVLDLHNLGPKQVIVTRGEHGVYFSCGEQRGMLPAEKVKAIDTSGAGDSFTAACAVAYARSRDWVQAISFATHAAAISVTRSGTQTSFATLFDL